MPIACIMGGIEAALIVALRIAKDQDLDWPLILMAVLSASLLAAGVLRHYWDIYVHRTVRGISFLFVGIDAAGDVFSLVSVIFQPKLDILGLVIYGSELILWIGVFACGGYYNLTPWARKKLANSTNGNASSAAQSSALDGADHATARVGHSASLTLHDMPSSTSVFRTPSGEVDIVRQRANRERE